MPDHFDEAGQKEPKDHTGKGSLIGRTGVLCRKNSQALLFMIGCILPVDISVTLENSEGLPEDSPPCRHGRDRGNLRKFFCNRRFRNFPLGFLRVV